MALRETLVFHSENHTENNEEICGKLRNILMLEQVIHVF